MKKAITLILLLLIIIYGCSNAGTDITQGEDPLPKASITESDVVISSDIDEADAPGIVEPSIYE